MELRAYGANLWSSTMVNSTSLDDAMTTGFSRLFAYISGGNKDSAKIDMTSPVLVKVVPGSGPNCASTFTVSFFVPESYQNAAGPPLPTNNLVFIQTIPALNVVVREFSGMAQQQDIISQAAQLEASVSNSTLVAAADGDNWWFAGYDPPFRLSNRHNEVWIAVSPKA